jgi:uncharacterized protein YjbI with pentapeptide repeats
MNEEDTKNIEQSLDSANAASQTVAALHIGFLAFLAYFGVIVWGTSHEDLLRDSPVKLPILDVELPLAAFFYLVPWMLVLLHFNLLMQLEMLSCKLWNLNRVLSESVANRQVRNRLFNYPFTHLIAGHSNVWLVRLLLSYVVGITLIALPLAMLLLAQIRFIPYHDEGITWSQRYAVWADSVVLMIMWPLIASPEDKPWTWWIGSIGGLIRYCVVLFRSVAALTRLVIRTLIQRDRGYTVHSICDHKLTGELKVESLSRIAFLLAAPLALLLSIIVVVPGTITLEEYLKITQESPQWISGAKASSHLEDQLIFAFPKRLLSVAVYKTDPDYKQDSVVCMSLSDAIKAENEEFGTRGVEIRTMMRQVMLGPCAWTDGTYISRNLYLREARLVPKEVSMSLLGRVTAADKQTRDGALNEFDGINLKDRDLRFADLIGAFLPKANLRHAQLRGARLFGAKLMGIIAWDKAQFQYAMFGGAELQEANLSNADLNGADLTGTNLEAATLVSANLESAELRGANLQNADLSGACLKRADLSWVTMPGVVLFGANLSYSNLGEAKLQGADLRYAGLQCAKMGKTMLQASSLDYANLQGTNMVDAAMQNAILLNTQLLGSDWAKAKLDGIYVNNASLENELGDSNLNVQSGEGRCFSNVPNILKCDYNDLEQLEVYENDVLYRDVARLACSNAAAAAGIVRRILLLKEATIETRKLSNTRESYDPCAPSSTSRVNDALYVNSESHPLYSMDVALIKALNNRHCPGLHALPKQTLEMLASVAEKHVQR